MLTDIFSYRYSKHRIWSSYTETEQRLLNQAFGIVKDALPYYSSKGKVNKDNEAKWKSVHNQLARELGVEELSKRVYSYQQQHALGHSVPVSGFFTWEQVCNKFVTAQFSSSGDADRFIKERISFVELALRLRGNEIEAANAKLPNALAEAAVLDSSPQRGIRFPGSAVDGIKARNASLNSVYNTQVEELNERFRRAGVPLSYHNGFIQVSQDEKVESHIAKPFWSLVSDPLWTNVDIDMKEALDQRDSNAKDPAIFAAKALESTIKIISDTKGWTRSSEKGAADYIDNLISKANGSYLLVWEGEMLKDYFRKVRNPVGHGPGSKPMPTLTQEQTDWAIETAMSWVRSLVRRM